MAWSKVEPQNTTKLRRLGIVIRPNWEAIEEADATFKPQALNLADRTPLVAPNDPTAIAASVILYSKQDGAGKPQVYSIDPDSSISQLTGMKTWARFVGTGGLGAAVINDSFNVSGVNKDTAQTFTISFDVNLANTDYGVLITTSSGTLPRPIVGTLALGSVQIYTGADASIITVMIIGG